MQTRIRQSSSAGTLRRPLEPGSSFHAPSLHTWNPGHGEGFPMVYSPQLGVSLRQQMVILTSGRVLPKTSGVVLQRFAIL